VPARRISMNLDTNVNNIMVKQADTFIYMGMEINQEEKTDREKYKTALHF
jgi:hypothetical protein